MKTLTASLATLLLWNVATAFAADADDVRKTTEYMAEYPPKVLAYGPNGLLQLVAEHGVTVNKKFQVIAVEASKTLPDVVWVFRDRAIAVKCEVKDLPPENRRAELPPLLESFSAMNQGDRAMLMDLADNVVAHVTCTSESNFFPRPQYTSLMGDARHLVMLQTPGYRGEVMFFAHFDAVRMDILAIGEKKYELKPPAP